MRQSEQRVTLEAFGSSALVAVTDAAELDTARTVVERIVAEFDVACSRFRDDSELSAVNADAGTPVEVGPVLLEAVTAALRAARLTGGDVDPTVGQALISLGYDRDFALLGGGGDRGRGSSLVLGSVPGWRTVTVDPGRSTVRVAPGVRLDLGATAKALAADRAAVAASAAAGCGVLVSFGGDLAIAGLAPGGRLARSRDGRSSLGVRRSRPVDLARLGRACHLEHRGPALADAHGDGAPPGRPADRPVSRQRVAHGERVRR